MSTSRRRPAARTPIRRPPGRLAVLVALAVLGGVLPVTDASIAGAAPTLLTSDYRLAGSEAIGLAGDETVVAGYDAHASANLIRGFAPGARPTVLARAAPIFATTTGSATLAGDVQLVSSPARLAVLDVADIPGSKNTPDSPYPLLAAGALGSPLQKQTAGCPLAPTIDPSVGSFEGGPTHAIALDGQVLAYDSYGCIIVKDFADGLQRTLPLQATLDPVSEGSLRELPPDALLKVAGHMLAYRANPFSGEGPAAVTVYDIERGEALYSAPLPPIEAGANQQPTFALQEDGTLVIAGEPALNVCQATVSTPAHPAPLALAVPACEISGLHGGRALITVAAGSNRTLAWVSLEDPVVHPIAALGDEGTLATTRPVTDGNRVAYSLQSCWRPDIYVTSLVEPGAPPPRLRRCPLVVVHDRATESKGRIKVQVSCPFGCTGSLRATVKTSRDGEEGLSLESEESRQISLAPGRSITQTLPSPLEQREDIVDTEMLARAMRKRHRAYLRLEFSSQTLTVPNSTLTVPFVVHHPWLVPAAVKHAGR